MKNVKVRLSFLRSEGTNIPVLNLAICYSLQWYLTSLLVTSNCSNRSQLALKSWFISCGDFWINRFEQMLFKYESFWKSVEVVAFWGYALHIIPRTFHLNLNRKAEFLTSKWSLAFRKSIFAHPTVIYMFHHITNSNRNLNSAVWRKNKTLLILEHSFERIKNACPSQKNIHIGWKKWKQRITTHTSMQSLSARVLLWIQTSEEK